jgi:SAM-dependent methyltransferase
MDRASAAGKKPARWHLTGSLRSPKLCGMANEEQNRLWNEMNAARWARFRAPLQRALAPFGEAALRALAPRAGEAALDVGCGYGDMTVALARATGFALGVDISKPFLEIARGEATAGATYLLADAQTHAFDRQFDLLFSRFGLMFFEDPGAAFANLRRALRPGARFSAVVWGPWQENEWVTLPLRALREDVADAPDPAKGPGPFALGDAARLTALLEGAGFERVRADRLALPFSAESVLLSQQGPAAAFLRETNASDAVRERFAARLAAALGGRSPGGLALVVTALAG